MSAESKPTDEDYEAQRIGARDALLDLANDALMDAVADRAKIVPMKELAALIRGDRTQVLGVIVARRAFIAKKLRAYDPRPEAEGFAKMLVDAKADGAFLPCVFFVGLNPTTIHVSIVMLRNEGVS